MCQLSPENERFIEEQLASGVFRTRPEVLNAGVTLLRMRNELLDRIDEGRRQLDSGQYTEYDEQGLQRRFEELKARARDRNQKGR